MQRTHAYLSGLVTVHENGLIESQVKARTFCASKGWVGQPKWDTSHQGNPRISLLSIGAMRSFLRENAVAVSTEVSTEVLATFRNLCIVIAGLHGEMYPTWIGDYYVTPEVASRGDSRVSRFLITEAPGLDCGTWEGDSAPVTGG